MLHMGEFKLGLIILFLSFSFSSNLEVYHTKTL